MTDKIDTSTEAAKLHDTTDAATWAKEFCKLWPSALCQITGKEGVSNGDDFEATMIGWFANAIMAGVDSEARALAAERDRLVAQLAEARAEGWRMGIEAVQLLARKQAEANLASRGEWPKAPEGVSASPPSYHKYPFKVEYCFGHGWTLFKHGAACTLVAISDHDTPQAALTAMDGAYDAFAADPGAPFLSARFDAARPDNRPDWRATSTKTEDGYNG